MKLVYKIAQLVGRANWLRLGIRRRIVRLLADAGSIEPARFEAEHFAGRYVGDLANAQDWHVFFFGGYELKELALMTDIVGMIEGATALDVGGNQGGHSLTLARVAERVHTIEPFPQLADRIDRLMKLNRCENVSVHRVGFGSEEGSFDYYLDPEDRNPGMGSFLPEHTGAQSAGQFPIVRGDDYFSESLSRLDFVKIDIEGFEAPALAGMHDLLRHGQPFVMIEVTESSAALIEEHGGFKSLFPFSFDSYEVINPSYPAKVFQTESYALSKIESINPRKNGFNVLIVPHRRRELFSQIADKVIG